MGKAAPALSNFNAGELSPDTAGRVDNEKYPVGCSTLENFIPRVQGGVRRRPGTRYVQSVRDSSSRTWLRKFIFSQGQAYQLEFGPGYIRFYTNHGRVSIPTQAAWSSGLTYSIGDVASVAGTNYYAIVSSTNQNPAATIGYWANMPFGIFEVPTPYITPGALTNSDGTCALQFEQSGDRVYITCPSYYTMQLTRKGTFTWVMEPYSPPDGPFLEQNSSSSPAMYLTTLSQGLVNCFATAPVFDPTDAANYSVGSPGRLVRLDVQYFNVNPWLEKEAVTKGDLRRFNGNTYKALNNGTTGPQPPIQTTGTQWDGKAGVQWLYQDSGYGIGRIVSYTSSTQVVLQVSNFADSDNQSYGFPADVFATSATITAITTANPPQVTTSGAHGFSVGDPVYLTGVNGMTQINNKMYVIDTVPSGSTFTIAGTDATGYSAYTSAGTALKNATLNWALGAWGIGHSGYEGSFPAALTFAYDRLFFGRGIQWWGSVPAQYGSHTQDLFSQVTADCAMNGLVASQNVDDITWLNGVGDVLLIGTRGGEFALSPLVSTDPIGPGNRQVKHQSGWRSRAIRPSVIGTTNFYVQSSGKKLMAQDYNFYVDRYDSTNQMRLANHIAGYTVDSALIDMDWHLEPYEVEWTVRSDGVLVGYVNDRADNVTGWYRAPMGASAAGAAVVECVSVIPAPDGTRDELWMIVRRTINGQTVRSVEYMEKDFETGDAQTSMCYLDMSGQYNGVATTTVTGLDWLEGETVSVLRDGGGHPDCIVTGGSITLQTAGSVVQVGLKCPSTLVTMDVEAGADVGTAQGKQKRVSQITVRIKNTLGGHAGMLGGTLDLLQPNVSTTALSSPPPLTTGDVTMSFPGDWDKACKIELQESQPFQMEVLAIFPIFTVNEPSP